MSTTAPILVEDSADWPQMTALQVNGEPCFALLAGTMSSQAALLDGKAAVALVLKIPGSMRGIYMPLGDRDTGNALIAAIREGMDLAGL